MRVPRKLRDVLGQELRSGFRLIIRSGWIFKRPTTCSGIQLPQNLSTGDACMNLLTQPIMSTASLYCSAHSRCGFATFSYLHRPNVRNASLLTSSSTSNSRLFGSETTEKRGSLLSGWQQARGIEHDATQKRLVITKLGRLNMQIAPTLRGELIPHICSIRIAAVDSPYQERTTIECLK